MRFLWTSAHSPRVSLEEGNGDEGALGGLFRDSRMRPGTPTTSSASTSGTTRSGCRALAGDGVCQSRILRSRSSRFLLWSVGGVGGSGSGFSSSFTSSTGSSGPSPLAILGKCRPNRRPVPNASPYEEAFLFIYELA